MMPEPHAAPLLKRLSAEFGYPFLDLAGAEAFIAQPGNACLFLPGDAERLDESADVAVVLPELVAAFGGTLQAAVITDKDTEREIQRRYRFNAFPALVFTRGGGWLGTIQRMQDWSDYLREIRTILNGEVKAPPRFALPEGCAANGAAQHTH